MKKPWWRFFRREQRRAARFVDSPWEVAAVAESASAKAHLARAPLARVWDDLQTSLRLVRAWARRDYRGVSRSTIALVVGGFLYLLSPIDAIVDAIPVIGLLDDAAVLAWVLRHVRWELEVFRDWEERRLAEVRKPQLEVTPAL